MWPYAWLPFWSEFSAKVWIQTISSKVVWKKSHFCVKVWIWDIFSIKVCQFQHNFICFPLQWQQNKCDKYDFDWVKSLFFKLCFAINCIWFHFRPIFCSSYRCLSNSWFSLKLVWFLAKNESEFSLILCILSLISIGGGLHII